MRDKLKIEYPSQGWKQIATGRDQILSAYDRARAKARAYEVEVLHGKVLEGEVRKWLSAFLPKRYGVTSGYIVSPGIPSTVRAPHFDVIIYDQLEAPVLWVDDNPDSSSQGTSLAIPVEYVFSVLEVKSSFTARTARQAIEHLSDLLPLMGALDDMDDPYKLHLPAAFSCGLVFCELRAEVQDAGGALLGITEGDALRGFFGGIVLRTARDPATLAGRIEFSRSDTLIHPANDKNPLLDLLGAESIEIGRGMNSSALLFWSESAFARFAFDLIALMQGKFHAAQLSSFYGQGSSVLERMRDAGITIEVFKKNDTT